MNNSLPHWEIVHTIIFDFDGVFTDNKVYLDQTGVESVACDRSDGLAFDILRRFSVINNWIPDCFVLSKESNPVVQKRCQKLNLKCFQSESNKFDFVCSYLINHSKTPLGTIYLGNDLNDLSIMLKEGIFSVAPQDAHPLILQYCDLAIDKNGGNGFVRSFVEKLIKLSDLSVDEVCALS